LSAEPDRPVAGAELLTWIERLVARARGAAVSSSSATQRLPRWIEALSADALLAASYAFGIRREPYERVTSTAAIVCPTTLQVAGILERGIARILRSGELRERCPSDLGTLVYEEGLQRLWLRGSEQGDRLAAAGLLRWMGCSPRRSRASSGTGEGQQGELFDLELDFG
jgi:hypothetical protein